MKCILLLSCIDRPGLVARISSFIFDHSGNILSLDEYVDASENRFFIRVAFHVDKSKTSLNQLETSFALLAKEFDASWQIKDTDKKQRVAIFVSRYDHCLREILWRYESGELPIEIPLVISNHEQLADLVEQHKLRFYFFPINANNKSTQESKEVELLRDHNIDTIVLARYMQILSDKFVSQFQNKIINIHHSFLPAFIGGDPYQQAHDRGVKIIGATSHYVTSDLDEGPIIEQDVTRISHKETRNELVRKGRDVERLVLARALDAHVNHRVLVSGHKTIVFA